MGVNERLRTQVPSGEVMPLLFKASGGRRVVRLRPSTGTRMDGVLLEVERSGAAVVSLDVSADQVAAVESADETELDYVVDGVEYTLITRFEARIPGDGRVRFQPSANLLRSQRRQWYRVLVSDGSELRFADRIRPIVDLGGNGVAVELDPSADSDLTEGLDLGRVRVCLPGQQVIETRATLRHLETTDAALGSKPRAGVQFVGLGEFDCDRLCRAVAAREREILGRRQHPRGSAPVGSIALVRKQVGAARVRRLLDIGSGGARFALVPDADRDLVAGVALPEMELRLRGAPSISVGAVIARLKQEGDDLSAGVEFKRISPEDREVLARYARAAAWGSGR